MRVVNSLVLSVVAVADPGKRGLPLPLSTQRTAGPRRQKLCLPNVSFESGALTNLAGPPLPQGLNTDLSVGGV